MKIGMGLGLSANRPVADSAPTIPEDLFGASDRGTWFDPSDTDTVATATNGTGAVSDGSDLRYIKGKGGDETVLTQAVTAPTWQTFDGLVWVENINTFGHLLSGGWTPRTPGVFTMVVGIKGVSGGAKGQGCFGIVDSTDPGDGATIYGVRSVGGVWRSVANGGVTTNTGLSSNLVDYVATLVGGANHSDFVTRMNGSVVGSAMPSGSPSAIASSALCLLPPINTRETIRVYSAFIIDRILDADEITFLEGIIATKSGVSL
jgi:hypothetical protein